MKADTKNDMNEMVNTREQVDPGLNQSYVTAVTWCCQKAVDPAEVFLLGFQLSHNNKNGMDKERLVRGVWDKSLMHLQGWGVG